MTFGNFLNGMLAAYASGAAGATCQFARPE